MLRGIFAIAAAMGLAILGVIAFDPYAGGSLDRVIQAELRDGLSPDQADAAIAGALARDDAETAFAYAETARYADIPLSEATEQRLVQAGAWFNRLRRGANQFTFGFVTGEAESLEALYGAVASDLTVIGDLRDLSREGGRMVAGENYNALLLGLSVVGIGVTGTTLASGGSTLVGRVGISLMKVAAKTGTLTADFARSLTGLVSRAVDLPLLRRTLSSVDLTDTRVTRVAVERYARVVRGAELYPVLNRMNDLRRATSASESVRLMRYVRQPDDLAELNVMAGRLGVKTRPVIEVTGKRSLRSFRVGLRLTEWILANILAFLSWLGSLVMLVLGRIGRLVR